MIPTSTINKFVDLYYGRDDVHGTEEGGCKRQPPDWDGHLDGTGPPIGIYPLVRREDGQLHVVWGCVDFDTVTPTKRTTDYLTERDAHVAACNLHATLGQMGIVAHIERTRSAVGRHVWVHAATWTPAADMRNMLLVACKVAETSTREVNPKQTQLADDQLGNYVRLPYPHHFPQRTIINTNSAPIGLETHVAYACDNLTDPALIAEWAARLPTSPAPTLRYAPPPDEDFWQKLNGKARMVLEEGPLQNDRSRALMYLAGQCVRSGLTGHEALAVIDHAAARWGKFDGRPDRDHQLRTIVQKAYLS